MVDEHRASGDARATLELFKLLKTKDNSHEIIQQHHEESNAKSYINKIKELTQDLPSEKGFVYFQMLLEPFFFEDYVDDIFRVSKNYSILNLLNGKVFRKKLPKLTTNLREQIRLRD